MTRARRGSIVAVLVAIAGVALFTTLLVYKALAGWPYVSLLAILTLASLAVYAYPRLKELDLKNMKLVLSEMHQVKADIYAKEKDLRRSSLLLAKLIAFNAAWHGRAHDDEGYRYQGLWIAQRVQELLQSLNVPPEQVQEVFRYQEALKEFDERRAAKGNGAELSKRLLQMLKNDCGEL